MEPTIQQSVKSLRILIAITKSNWGGAQRYVFDVAHTLHTQGHHVSVMLGGAGELSTRLTEAGIEVFSIPSLTRDVGLLRELRAFSAIIKTIRETRPDVLHLNSSKMGGLGALAGRLLRVRRIIFTAHGWAFNEERPWISKVVVHMTYWCTILLTHRTIAVSDATFKDMAHLPLMQSRMTVIRLGCAAPALLSRDEARSVLSRKYPALEQPFSSGAPVFVTVAELHPIKGHCYALAVCERMKRADTAFYWVFAGDGELKEMIEREVEARHLGTRVVLLGHVEHVASHLSAFDVLVLSSLSEGLGYVLLEAGHAKLPVVATRVGGVPEVIRDGDTGLLVPPYDTGALEHAIHTLMSDREKARVLGDTLHTFITTHHTLSGMVHATLNVYRPPQGR